MSRYSLDITRSKTPFINIEVDEAGAVHLGTYEDGKITKKLHSLYKQDIELLIKGLEAINKLIV